MLTAIVRGVGIAVTLVAAAQAQTGQFPSRKAGMKPGDVVMEGVPRTNLLNREGAAPSSLSPEQLKALREDMERRMRESSAK